VDVPPELAAQHVDASPPQGVVLLFDSRDADSFSHARDAVQASGSDAEVQLCIASGVTPPAGEPVPHRHVTGWGMFEKQN